jgi:PAS domain S-box-containing protein
VIVPHFERRENPLEEIQSPLFVQPQNAATPPEFSGSNREYFLPYQRIDIPIHSIGPDGLLLEVNEAWVDYTGYSRNEALGRSFADFLDPTSATLYGQDAVPELINTVPAQESRSVEYRLLKSSGDVVDVVLTARPQRHPVTGRFLYSLTVINDVTARNRAEKALRQAQKLEALGLLTGGVAHDFNNLLAIIQGSLELLLRHLPPEDARASRLMETALQGAKRGAAMTARLLAFARQQELSPQPVVVRTLIASLRPMLVQLLGPDITLTEELSPDLWTLRADPNQLELSLLNLAANARDAMPDGGRLRLAARNATIALSTESIFIESRPQAAIPAGEHVVLSVCDNGTGMDEAALARAADPFFTTKGLGKGTGLGLSMVHGFAVQSGGALLLSSQLGVGTVVEIWLPRATAVAGGKDATRASTVVTSKHRGRPLRILLVDDDLLVVAGATAMLEELGHEVSSATSGADALTLVGPHGHFDLMLTDYMMPDMSGAQLAAQVRALHPSLPILLASGFAELEGAVETAWPRLRKPFSLGDLSAALAQVMPHEQ